MFRIAYMRNRNRLDARAPAKDPVGDQGDVLAALPQDQPPDSVHRPEDPVAGEQTTWIESTEETTVTVNAELR